MNKDQPTALNRIMDASCNSRQHLKKRLRGVGVHIEMTMLNDRRRRAYLSGRYGDEVGNTQIQKIPLRLLDVRREVTGQQKISIDEGRGEPGL